MAIPSVFNSVVLSSYLILWFYHLIKDFISNSRCSAKEAAALWKEMLRDHEASKAVINLTRNGQQSVTFYVPQKLIKAN